MREGTGSLETESLQGESSDKGELNMRQHGYKHETNKRKESEREQRDKTPERRDNECGDEVERAYVYVKKGVEVSAKG